MQLPQGGAVRGGKHTYCREQSNFDLPWIERNDAFARKYKLCNTFCTLCQTWPRCILFLFVLSRRYHCMMMNEVA